jgi:hypothetical protein
MLVCEVGTSETPSHAGGRTILEQTDQYLDHPGPGPSSVLGRSDRLVGIAEIVERTLGRRRSNDAILRPSTMSR